MYVRPSRVLCALALLVALGAGTAARESSLVDAVRNGDAAARALLIGRKADVNAAERTARRRSIGRCIETISRPSSC